MVKKVLLKYKQRESKPNTTIERYGIKEIVCQIGFIDYDQEEVVNLSEVEARIKELKSITNRRYHSFKYKEL